MNLQSSSIWTGHLVSGSASQAGSGALSKALFHGALALLQVGVALVLMTFGPGKDIRRLAFAHGLVICGSFLFSAVLTLCGSRSYPVGTELFRLLVVFITFSGLLGLTLNGDSLYDGILFFILLALRNYTCFWGLTGTEAYSPAQIQRAILTWTMIATTCIAIGSLLAFRSGGISLGSTTRINGDKIGWLNENTVGLYCAFGLLLCVLARYLPAWIRIAVAALSAYCLLLSQSRTAIIALLAGVVTALVLSKYRRRMLVALSALALFVVMGLGNRALQFAVAIPTVASTLDRFEGDQASVLISGRMDVLRTGLDIWASSPLVGIGYGTSDTRFENGYLSMACESGSLGLLAYLFYLVLVLFQSRVLMASRDPDANDLGRWLACITIFAIVHGFGERTHAFQIATMVSACWVLLTALAFRRTVYIQSLGALQGIHPSEAIRT